MSAVTELTFTQPSRTARIGLTSLIDVVFMLLMFFMLASSFERWRSIQLDAELEGPSVVRDEQRNIVLRVYPDYISLGERRLELAQLRDALSLAKTAKQVVLMPMPDTRLQRVVDVMDRLRVIGIGSPVVNIN